MAVEVGIVQPGDITLIDPTRIVVRWQDNTSSHIDAERLRRSCPCTSCAGREGMRSATYVPLVGAVGLRIRSIDIVGSSRLWVTWEDAHDRSIYRFDDLHKLFPPDPTATHPAE